MHPPLFWYRIQMHRAGRFAGQVTVAALHPDAALDLARRRWASVVGQFTFSVQRVRPLLGRGFGWTAYA